VINIVTSTPSAPETNLSLGAGSFGRYKGVISHGRAMGDGKFFGSVGYETYDGDFKYWNDNGTPYDETDDYTGKRRNNGFENMDVLLKWEDENWRARASWVRRDRRLALMAPGFDYAGAPPVQSPQLDTDRWDISLGRSQTFGDVNWGWTLMYTGQRKQYDSHRGSAPSAIGGTYVTKSEYDSARMGLSLFANWVVGERHFMELFAEYSGERLGVEGDMLFSNYLNGIDQYDRKDYSVSLQDSIALDRTGSLLFTPSLRWHKLDGEDHFTWQMALTKEFSPRLMFKTAYGTYARSPNLYERYGDGAFILPAREDLKWETGTQLDASVIWRIPGLPEGLRSSVSLSGFWRESKNLIEFDMENPRFGIYTNIAKATVKGVELEAALDWKKWNMSFSGTWLDGENRTSDQGSVRYRGMKLPNRPEWSWTARLTRGFGDPGRSGSGSVFAEYRYVGENYVDKSEKTLFEARNIWNVGVKYSFSESIEMILGVNDVFDNADGWLKFPDTLNGPARMLDYPVEGRSYYMTLNIEL
jgi:outer membrane cobalamin receptor